MSQANVKAAQCHWIQKFAKPAAILLTFFCFPVSSAYSEELNFLTWADYIDPEIVTEFEQETGITINITYFESDDARDEMINNQEGKGYDLATINGLMLKSYSMRNWLAPIDSAAIPNVTHIDTRWLDAFPASKRYAVPYFWGTLGIAYRKDLFPNGFKSWKDFFEPAAELQGKIAMFRSSRDILGMALKSLGYSVNTNDRNKIKEAGQLLMSQRPSVHSYGYISLNEQSALVTGDVWASIAYNGDALMLQEHHEEIEYVIPNEGGNLWVDYLAILQSSPKKDLASKFVNYLNQPKTAARNAEYVYYASPNQAALLHVSDEYAEDKTINPELLSIENSEPYQELAPRSQKTVNSIFINLLN